VSVQRYVSEELTHFVGRGLRCRPDSEEQQYALLTEILRLGRLGTSKNKNIHWTDAYKFSDNEYYKPNVVCFSDIPVADLAIHMGKFSRFGLAFKKSFLVEKGANPVFYLARNALVEVSHDKHVDLARHFDERHEKLLSFMKEIRNGAAPDDPGLTGGLTSQEITNLMGFLVSRIFSFCKFFDAGLADDDQNNYYMEREWRIFGSLEFDLEAVRRVIFPEPFAKRFRADVPDYFGEITFS
jgi:hypothetical protein